MSEATNLGCTLMSRKATKMALEATPSPVPSDAKTMPLAMDGWRQRECLHVGASRRGREACTRVAALARTDPVVMAEGGIYCSQAPSPPENQSPLTRTIYESLAARTKYFVQISLLLFPRRTVHRSPTSQASSPAPPPPPPVLPLSPVSSKASREPTAEPPAIVGGGPVVRVQACEALAACSARRKPFPRVLLSDH